MRKSSAILSLSAAAVATVALVSCTPVPTTGAQLSVAPAPTVQSAQGPTAACTALATTGWTVTQCQSFALTGGHQAYLVERQGSGATATWHAFVMHFSTGNGTWLVDLRKVSTTPGELQNIHVVATDLTADGVPDLVVGERHSGTGQILDYDIVTGLNGTPHVAAHREVYHGALKVYPGQLIDDYQAEYPHGEPNCCPGYIQQTVVLWDSTRHQFVSGPGHQYAPTVSFPTDPF
jgi:hypothetical protein